MLHTPSEDYNIPGQDDGIAPGTLVIILHEAARLVEDDLHLVPEHSIVAIGDALAPYRGGSSTMYARPHAPIPRCVAITGVTSALRISTSP